MSPSDWASWVQAVGSIAAILGAFRIARQQHEVERETDRVRRHEEKQNDLDRQLQQRTLAVRNVVQVAAVALESARVALAHSRSSISRAESEPFLIKVEQLRAVLDSLIHPETEHLAVISALSISQILVLVHTDLCNTGGPNTPTLLDRSESRVNEGHEALARLIDLQSKLDELCRARGLPFEIDDFRPTL